MSKIRTFGVIKADLGASHRITLRHAKRLFECTFGHLGSLTHTGCRTQGGFNGKCLWLIGYLASTSLS